MVYMFTKFYIFYYYSDHIEIYGKYLRNNNIPLLQFTTFCLAKVAQLTIVHYYTSLTYFLTPDRMLQMLKLGFAP